MTLDIPPRRRLLSREAEVTAPSWGRFSEGVAAWDVLSAVQVMRLVTWAGLVLRYLITRDAFSTLRNSAWLIALALFFLYSAAVAVDHFWATKRSTTNGVAALVLLDTVSFSGFYLLSGSPSSDIFLFYFLPLLIAADRFKGRPLVAIFVLVCISYIAIAVALSAPGSPLAIEPPGMSLPFTIVRHILPRAAFFFLVWFIALARGAAFRHETEELRAANETALSVNRGDTLEMRLSAIRDGARERLDADGCDIYLVTDLGDLELVTITGLGSDAVAPGHRLPIGRGAVGVAFATGKSQLVNRYQEYPERLPLFEDSVRAAIAVPLLIGDRKLGAICVFDTTGHRKFTENDARALERLAQHATVAIRNSQLLHQVTEQARQLEARVAVSQGRSDFLSVLSDMLVSQSTDGPGVYDRVLSACEKLVPSLHSCIWLVNQPASTLVLRATKGIAASEFRPVIPINGTITGDAVMLNAPQFHPDCGAEHFRHKFANPAKLDFRALRAMACVPVRTDPVAAGPQYVVTFFFSRPEDLPGREQIDTLREHLGAIFNLAAIFLAQQMIGEFRQIDSLALQPGLRYQRLAAYLAEAISARVVFLFVWDPLRNVLILRAIGPADACSDVTRSAILGYDPLSGLNGVCLSPGDETCNDVISHGDIALRVAPEDWRPFETLDASGPLSAELTGLVMGKSACLAPVTDLDGRTKGVIISVDKYNPVDGQTEELFSFEDVALLSAARQAFLVRLERDEFTTYVSSVLSTGTHELGLPIRSIADYIEFCMKNPHRPPRYSEMEEVKTQTDLLLLILRGISVSGQNYGLRQPVMRPLALEEDVMRFVQGVIKPAARQKGVRFDNIGFFGDSVPRFESDRALLRQVFFNLLSNAVKYAGRRRQDFKVLVRWIRDGSYVLVTVEDYGMGISKADGKRVFEYGFRATDARKVDAHGIGVGLTVSKRIMVSLGGDLELVNLAQPTSFVVRIPLAPPRPEDGAV